MDSQQLTKEAIAPEGGSETAPQTPTDGDLLAEAMACVAWDGTVDTDRLASIEFAHDEATVRRTVALALKSFESPAHARAGFSKGITVGGIAIHDRWASNSITVVRNRGAWSIATESHIRTPTMTDEAMVMYCALVARHMHFSMTWTKAVDDDVRGNNALSDFGYPLEWKGMWLSRVIDALAGASGPWTGVEVMCTQSLARALLAVLRARIDQGPLAPVDWHDGARPAPPAVSSSDSIVLSKLRHAIGIAASMPAEMRFSHETCIAWANTTYDAAHAIRLLGFVVNAAQPSTRPSRSTRRLCCPPSMTRCGATRLLGHSNRPFFPLVLLPLWPVLLSLSVIPLFCTAQPQMFRRPPLGDQKGTQEEEQLFLFR
ncbi:hypothetical protein TW95_gp0231 [Pandoravirus inopinatum]|uniref:Uncharacterized protein n=1 Tax=Pandoravirus inopinatum TaxID=1605721 RepID=A0A0B5J5M2_9VIRU|nr:hypothetical protein TW95_gp0231 [Pandoravirus inopinatum]AJF96965.1 hypothetical protein [Pandoravirus inopinatum]